MTRLSAQRWKDYLIPASIGFVLQTCISECRQVKQVNTALRHTDIKKLFDTFSWYHRCDLKHSEVHYGQTCHCWPMLQPTRLLRFWLILAPRPWPPKLVRVCELGFMMTGQIQIGAKPIEAVQRAHWAGLVCLKFTSIRLTAWGAGPFQKPSLSSFRAEFCVFSSCLLTEMRAVAAEKNKINENYTSNNNSSAPSDWSLIRLYLSLGGNS